MVTGIFNKGYDTSYFLMPLKKTNNEFTVSAKNSKVKEAPEFIEKNYEDIKKADKDKNGIVDLKELQKSAGNSPVLNYLLDEMTAFDRAHNYLI